MSDEAESSEANFEKAMNERLKPIRHHPQGSQPDEKRFLFGYDEPNLDGARGNTRIVNHYFSHENSFWQQQKTNKDAPLYSKLELPYVWKKVDANAFFHLRSARLSFHGAILTATSSSRLFRLNSPSIRPSVKRPSTEPSVGLFCPNLVAANCGSTRNQADCCKC